MNDRPIPQQGDVSADELDLPEAVDGDTMDGDGVPAELDEALEEGVATGDDEVEVDALNGGALRGRGGRRPAGARPPPRGGRAGAGPRRRG